MSLSLYEVAVPTYVRMLQNLTHFLDKAEAYAGERKIALQTLAVARLAPDMHSLIGQVQLASDAAKSGAARLAGVEPPSFPDTETTYEELKARIAKTIDFVQGITPEQLNGREDATVELKLPGRTMTFTGRDFLLTFALPNFMFHVTAAYAILRSQGAPLGKMDFLAGAQTAA